MAPTLPPQLLVPWFTMSVGTLVEAAPVLIYSKAFDEVIHDGVDVLSVSLGLGDPYNDVIAVGSLHAVLKGITIETYCRECCTPWIISVAAGTMDRSFPSPITLGNNQTIMVTLFLLCEMIYSSYFESPCGGSNYDKSTLGQAMFAGHKEIAFKGLVCPKQSGFDSTGTW
ncbi:subtilisin-like protein protease SBT3.8 [Cinnamomum micranthum f. kanehirae]|uniref:Subtilisin-like protein protease SBT3.8 n=1 Tax=Cinnamomum micranthum f. kanehirae TaxID=337451 RepID=A0A3S3NX45_9MAGN|nr:subtilisin-like protein protease SBT3.8 [Cinnamomum micranthum f. kanehirae]